MVDTCDLHLNFVDGGGCGGFLMTDWPIPSRKYGPIARQFRKLSIAGYNGWYWVTHPHKLWGIPQHYIGLFRAFVQRGRRGYAVRDTWSLDSYLLSWLPDALADLRDGSYGYPTEEGMTYEKWCEILTDMETTLRGLEKNPIFASDEEMAEFKRVWDLMGEYFFCLWN